MENASYIFKYSMLILGGIIVTFMLSWGAINVKSSGSTTLDENDYQENINALKELIENN